MFKITTGSIVQRDDIDLITTTEEHILIKVEDLKGYLLRLEEGKNYVIPFVDEFEEYTGNDILWLMPLKPDSDEKAIMLRSMGSSFIIRKEPTGVQIIIENNSCEIIYYENRPQCDIFGNRIILSIDKGDLFQRMLAAFYWDSMLPMVIERTSAKDFPFSDGYVLSTLEKGAYPGTYPDVDHEFQIKGRIAMANPLNLDIVKRMLELQIDVMKRDPDGLWRNPCSVQPQGICEYHVRRGCFKGNNEATMFLLTGNIEIVESIWLYISVTKDFKWLEANIQNLENIVGLIESYIDEDYKLWSDVYYEDQVIKDGSEAIAQAFAANSFLLLSRLEELLGRKAESQKYLMISKKLSKTLTAPIPKGFWDPDNNRFIDWVDRKGEIHDHIHLLANELPVVFGYADEAQEKAIKDLVNGYMSILQKFPSFVSPRIEDYRDDEIGDGGPYDLCAAGRYWCWDAAYYSALNSGAMLKEQLTKVAIQGIQDGYVMSERYDMNHVYYMDDKNWHGASHYYEYPNVFAWVLINEYLGIKPSMTCNWLIKPRLVDYGKIELNFSNINLAYKYNEKSFEVSNLKDVPMDIILDLSGIYPANSEFINENTHKSFKNNDKITLSAKESVIIRIDYFEDAVGTVIN